MAAEPHSILVGARALDGLSMRMAAIAHNLANAGSPRFQAVAVNFEQSLRAAETQGQHALEHLRFRFSAGEAYGPNDDRRVDLLIADAAQTAMRYSALVDMLSRRLALRQAAFGGQR